MSDYRVALIGAGGRAHAHAEAYGEIAGARLCACADPTADRREALAARFKLTPYADAGDMISRERPDLVHIITPPAVRASVLQLVSDHGVPAATIEKPVASGVDDWRALCRIADRTRTKIAVCHQFRWHADLIRCREALASGELGAPLFAEGTAGMNVTNQGTHALHYAGSLLEDSPAVTVFGTAAGWDGGDPSHPGPLTTLGHITLQSGARLLWNTGPTAPRVGDPDTTWQHVRVAVYAERGRVMWEEFGRWHIEAPGRSECGIFGGMGEWSRGNLLAQAAFHREMLRWIEDDSSPAGTHLARSLHEWKAVLALYASALERRPIALAAFDPPGDLLARIESTLNPPSE